MVYDHFMKHGAIPNHEGFPAPHQYHGMWYATVSQNEQRYCKAGYYQMYPFTALIFSPMHPWGSVYDGDVSPGNAHKLFSERREGTAFGNNWEK